MPNELNSNSAFSSLGFSLTKHEALHCHVICSKRATTPLCRQPTPEELGPSSARQAPGIPATIGIRTLVTPQRVSFNFNGRWFK